MPDLNPNLCDVGAELHQLSYQANWELFISWFGSIINPQMMDIDISISPYKRVFNKKWVLINWGFDHLNYATIESLKDMSWRFERSTLPSLERRVSTWNVGSCFQTFYSGKILNYQRLSW